MFNIEAQLQNLWIALKGIPQMLKDKTVKGIYTFIAIVSVTVLVIHFAKIRVWGKKKKYRKRRYYPRKTYRRRYYKRRR
jgi:hypothetical protein